jgi:protein-tyrosine phosphatase
VSRPLLNVLALCCFLIVATYASESAKTPPQQKRILFICTGNYYRSRFAEALFNQKARDARLDWHAVSRGLNLVPWQFGISKYAQQELIKRGVGKEFMAGGPKRLTKQDLLESDRIIVMDESEHRPLLEKKFPTRGELNLQYWHVPDTGGLKPTQACAMMSKKIDHLIDQLNSK